MPVLTSGPRLMSGAEKRYWSPDCCADGCDQPPQYRVYDRYGQVVAGEWCHRHADEQVAHLDRRPPSGSTER